MKVTPKKTDIFWRINMSVSQTVSDDGKLVEINIKGRFNYKLSEEFTNSYRHLPEQKGVNYHVNLSDANYMDSSALGMLLLLREHAKCRDSTVFIDQPSTAIGKILKVANFEKLFSIN